jgi:hypothetical protein
MHMRMLEITVFGRLEGLLVVETPKTINATYKPVTLSDPHKKETVSKTCEILFENSLLLN